MTVNLWTESYKQAELHLMRVRLELLDVQRDMAAFKQPYLEPFAENPPSAEWKLDLGLEVLLGSTDEYKALRDMKYELVQKEVRAKAERDIAFELLKTYRAECYLKGDIYEASAMP